MAVSVDQAFQWIFDNAETIAMNRKPVIATTATRDGTVRTVSRGGNIWRFTVKMPNGFRYSEVRDYLAALDYSEKLTPGNISLDNPGSDWLSNYKGELTSGQMANVTANITSTSLNTLNVSNIGAVSNGTLLFAQGDFLQLKTSGTNRASVYTVIDDVVKAGSSEFVPLNRPLLNWDGNTTTTYGVSVGTDVRWIVKCIRCPAWTVAANQLVIWEGDFEFVEDLYTGREGNV